MTQILAAVCLALVSATPAAAKNMAPITQGVGAVTQEKRSRTPAQQKIDTQLLYALYRERGEAETKGVPAGDLRVTFDQKHRALVSIRARVTKDLLATIKKLGGEVISSSERYSDIRANLALAKLEDLAALPDVRAIAPAEEATTRRVKSPAGAQ